ncbi:MAG: DMT family transporter [Desulfobacterales bacterium]|jgi:drug/metabolite transporter (DMT)-like permease
MINPKLTKSEEIPIQNRLNLRNRFLKGALWMLAAGLMFAVFDGLIKLMRPEFRVWDIAFTRWGIGIVLLITIFGRQTHLFKTHNLKLMTIRSIIGCITFLCLTSAIRDIPISTAWVLFFSFPAFAVLFSYLVFGERISKGQIACIVGGLIGVAVLLGFKFDGNVYGYLMGLLSGVFAGITVNLIKQLREKDGPVTIYFYFCLLGALITIPVYIADPIIPASGIEWMMAGGIAATSTLAQLLMNQGYRYCKSWGGGLFLTSEMVFTATLGIVFLGEIVSWRFWFGGILILSSTVLLNLKNIKSASQ